MTSKGARVPVVPGCTDLVEVGRGGFAVVYRAHQPSFDRDVAVKVVNNDILGDELAARFVRECQAIGGLSWHPNVVTVYDAGTTDEGNAYLVMAWMEGGALADEVSGGPLHPRRVLEVGVAIAGALEASHRAGRLHRDVKPENILAGPMGVPQLADFGIAAVAGQTITTDGGSAFSPHHVPPEVIGGRPATPASDIYSLASTLYTLATGRPAFQRDTDDSFVALLARIVTELPPPLPPTTPPQLGDAIARALAKDPADRPPSAGAYALELEAVATGLGWHVAPAVLGSGPPTETLKRAVAPGRVRSTEDAEPPAPPVPAAPTPASPRRSRRWLAARLAVGALLIGPAVAMVLGSAADDDGATPPVTTGSASGTSGRETSGDSDPETAGGDAEALLVRPVSGFESRPGTEQFRTEAELGARRVDPDGEIIVSTATAQLLRNGEPVALAIAYGLSPAAANPLVVQDRIVAAALDPGAEKEGEDPTVWRGEVTGTDGQPTAAAVVLLDDVALLLLASDPGSLDPLVAAHVEAAATPS